MACLACAVCRLYNAYTWLNFWIVYFMLRWHSTRHIVDGQNVEFVKSWCSHFGIAGCLLPCDALPPLRNQHVKIYSHLQITEMITNSSQRKVCER